VPEATWILLKKNCDNLVKSAMPGAWNFLMDRSLFLDPHLDPPRYRLPRRFDQRWVQNPGRS
jgi:hypothetical protein